MSASQFRLYTSSDASGPGAMTGAAGSLLSILDACLVNGYTGHAAAGWTKPFSNSGNIGCYVQNGGSGFGIVVNDNGPDVSASFREAWVTGWKSITAISGPVGTGTGQFPLPGQLLTTGHVVCRKSTTADSTSRTWALYADATTFYLFVKTGDNASNYFDLAFGDMFSLWGSSDVNRCVLIGRNLVNSGSINLTSGHVDRMINPLISSNIAGAYVADNFAGTSGSIVAYCMGDLSKAGSLINGSSPVALSGAMPAPNAADNSYYLSPVWVSDSSWSVRGRLRGLYHLCHAVSSFSDGQTFNGANDYAGKTFTVLLQGTSGGLYCIETSNTVDTN
jgi:hypothetical protein